MEEFKAAAKDASLMMAAGSNQPMSGGSFYRRLKYARVKENPPIVDRLVVREEGQPPVIELWREGLDKVIADAQAKKLAPAAAPVPEATH